MIDIETFTQVSEIEVAINLFRLRADNRGNLYVSSRGDYYETPSKLFVIDTQTETITKTFDISCANMAMAGDTLYVIGSEFSYITFDWDIHYSMIDTQTATLLPESFIPQSIADNITLPYGVAVDPISKDIYITDAKDFVSPGALYCISSEGELKFTVTTGDIPVHFAFVKESTTIW